MSNSHTLAEAESKWCPMSRGVMLARPNGPYEKLVFVGNRDHMLEPRGTCVGDKCMMWQWGEPRSVITTSTQLIVDDNIEEPSRDNTLSYGQRIPDDYIWVVDRDHGVCYWAEPLEKYIKRRRGRCGLAK